MRESNRTKRLLVVQFFSDEVLADPTHFSSRERHTRMVGNAQSCARRALEEAVARKRDRSVAVLRPAPHVKPVPAAIRRHHVEHWDLLTADAEHSSQGYLPFRVVKPVGGEAEGRRLPTVVMLHPTGADQNYHVGWEANLVDRGFLTVSLDLRYHGSRQDDAITYQEAIRRSFADESFAEKPFLLDNVWDLQHVLDALEDRPDVGKIGITGLSLGGMVSWLLAVIDERVYAPVPLCGVQSFAYAIENNQFHERAMSIPEVFRAVSPGGFLSNLTPELVARVWHSILPGLLQHYDAAMSLGCIAPRPLLVVTGSLDGRNPVQGVREAVDAARVVYEEQGVGGCLELYAQDDAGHELTLSMRDEIDRWFDRWLV